MARTKLTGNPKMSAMDEAIKFYCEHADTTPALAKVDVRNLRNALDRPFAYVLHEGVRDKCLNLVRNKEKDTYVSTFGEAAFEFAHNPDCVIIPSGFLFIVCWAKAAWRIELRVVRGMQVNVYFRCMDISKIDKRNRTMGPFHHMAPWHRKLSEAMTMASGLANPDEHDAVIASGLDDNFIYTLLSGENMKWRVAKTLRKEMSNYLFTFPLQEYAGDDEEDPVPPKWKRGRVGSEESCGDSTSSSSDDEAEALWAGRDEDVKQRKKQKKHAPERGSDSPEY